MCFDRKGKPSPHYIGPYKIAKKIGKVAYELELPAEMSIVHPVFHVSILRLYRTDPSNNLSDKEVQIYEGLSYEEKSVQILDHQV